MKVVKYDPITKKETIEELEATKVDKKILAQLKGGRKIYYIGDKQTSKENYKKEACGGSSSN
jgi:hypothetical protein